MDILAVNYNPKDGSYLIWVSLNTSTDTHFSLSYRGGEIFRVDYETAVLSGMNTINRFCDEFKKALMPLIQAEIHGVTHMSVIPEKLTEYHVGLDAPFDKTLIGEVEVVIQSTGGTDAEHLSAILKTVYQVMKENNFAAANFGIVGQHGTSVTELRNIRASHIEDKDLEGILQKALRPQPFHVVCLTL